MAVGKWYDFHEFGWYMGNVGYNDANPKPFIWKADPNHIIATRNRGFQTLESIHKIKGRKMKLAYPLDAHTH